MSRQRARTSADMFLQEARPRAALRWSSFFCSTRWADLRRDVFHRRKGRTDFRPARQSSNHFEFGRLATVKGVCPCAPPPVRDNLIIVG